MLHVTEGKVPEKSKASAVFAQGGSPRTGSSGRTEGTPGAHPGFSFPRSSTARLVPLQMRLRAQHQAKMSLSLQESDKHFSYLLSWPDLSLQPTSLMPWNFSFLLSFSLLEKKKIIWFLCLKFPPRPNCARSWERTAQGAQGTLARIPQSPSAAAQTHHRFGTEAVDPIFSLEMPGHSAPAEFTPIHIF